jgi:hypothetical protein
MKTNYKVQLSINQILKDKIKKKDIKNHTSQPTEPVTRVMRLE